MVEPGTLLLYVAGKKLVMAVDPSTGSEVWTAPIEGNGIFGTGVVTLLCDGERLYAGRGGMVTAFDALTGQRLWSKNTPDGISPTPMLAMAGISADNAAVTNHSKKAQQSRSG